MTQQFPFYLVDAFTSAPFTGNPAAICPLRKWPEDALLQSMTIEHNQSETAFFVQRGNHYELRWFTTGDGEIDLCGHATLASAHVIFEHIGHETNEIVFQSRFSGELRVTRKDGWYTLDFPSWMPTTIVVPLVQDALGFLPLESLIKRDYLFVLPDETAVKNFIPDFSKLALLNNRVCITAPGDEVDFVSRFFNPNDSMPEDPVTGSAHSMLIPFWGQRLNKTTMLARQLSARGGELKCEWAGERVLISGKARTYLTGTIFMD